MTTERMLATTERLFDGQYYRFWWLSSVNPASQAFVDNLEGKGIDVQGGPAGVTGVGQGAYAFVGRVTEEMSFIGAASHVAFAVTETTGRGVNPDAVAIYSVAGPPGILDVATTALRDAGDSASRVVGNVGREARETTQALRGVAENYSRALKWAAIGVPVAAAILGIGWIIHEWRRA